MNEYEGIGIFEGTKEWQLYQTRLIRNGFLDLTDKYLLPDYPITPENFKLLKHTVKCCENGLILIKI